MNKWVSMVILIMSMQLVLGQDSLATEDEVEMGDEITDTTRVDDTIKVTASNLPHDWDDLETQIMVVDADVSRIQKAIRQQDGVIDSAEKDRTYTYLQVRNNRIRVLKRSLDSLRNLIMTAELDSGAVSSPEETNSQLEDLHRWDTVLNRVSTDIHDLVMWLGGESDADLTMVDTSTAEMDTVSAGGRGIVRRVTSRMSDGHSLEAFFDASAWGSRILLILLTGGYLYFLIRLGKKSEDMAVEKWYLYKNQPLWIPALKALVFFGALLPLFSFHIPVFIIQVNYLLIFLVLYVLLYQQYADETQGMIVSICATYILLIGTSLILSDEWWSRSAAIVMNIVGLMLTWLLGRQKKAEMAVSSLPRFAKWVIVLGFLMAAVTAGSGHMVTCRILSITASVGLIQILVLTAFKRMVLHDVSRYYQESDETHGIRRFNLDRMMKSLGRLIAFCNTFVILIVLVNNLRIVDQVVEILDAFLFKDRKIGNAVFHYANLFGACLILWLANWLQKNLNQLFNVGSQEDGGAKKNALFPLFRLLVVVIGFLIAIGILGFGVTQLTVIIGALSVGIGLGLQNIINNFVSGIILIFEKPFKIGDYIELADRKGRVHEIGIRSSVLMTDQGAKVIIPNGDLLAGRIVNWTFSNREIRVNVELVVSTAMAVEDIKQRLRALLKNDKYVDTNAPIVINTKSIQTDTFTLSVQNAIKDVRHMERFKGAFLEKVKKEMDTLEIKVSSA